MLSAESIASTSTSFASAPYRSARRARRYWPALGHFRHEIREAQGAQAIGSRVEAGSIIHADEARGWDALHDRFLTKRINHQECYSDGEACTNQAESFFSRLRRAEIGIHHHISGRYLHQYANEMAWRENNRRASNGAQYFGVAAALDAPVSRQWKGD